MAVSDEYRANFEDQFDEFRPVQIRRIFGGVGIYRESVTFALVARDTVFRRPMRELGLRLQSAACPPLPNSTKTIKRR